VIRGSWATYNLGKIKAPLSREFYQASCGRENFKESYIMSEKGVKMRARGLITAFLLGVGLSFVPGLGQGEIKSPRHLGKISSMDWRLLQATVNYMQENPTNFLRVHICYDEDGSWEESFFPKHIDTRGKVCLLVGDNIFRGDDERLFCGKSGTDLLNEFKRQLENIYSFIEDYATEMNTDIAAYFYTRERKPSLGIPLGYFYQGEYHLWGK